MIQVIRDGRLVFVDRLKTGDVIVTESTSNETVYVDSEWQVDIEKVKINALNYVNVLYNNVINSGTTISVTIGVTNFRVHMPAGFEPATRLKAAIEVATSLGLTTIDVVDYNDKIIKDVPLDKATEAANQQMIHYRLTFLKKSDLRWKIKNATDIEEIREISW